MVINNKNIDKLITATSFIDNTIDHKIGELSKTDNLTVYVLNPMIVSAVGSETSTIRNMSIETFVQYSIYK
jgi:hypothetical protein